MKTNPAIHWRLDLARQIAEKLTRMLPTSSPSSPTLRAIVVAGSVARGYADDYSDLELPLFWDEPPTGDLRLEIAAALGADFLYPFNSAWNEDDLLIHGFQVDLWHNTVAQEEQVFEAVLDGLSLDPGDHNFMDTVQTCIPLYGDDLIRRWKEKAAAYPEPLAVRQVQRVIGEMEATHLALLARRGNPTLLYGQISRLQRQLFLILLALNRRYFPTYKWLYPVLEALPVKPPAAADRFRRAYTIDPLEAAEDTRRLVEETLTLVRQHLPQVDPGNVLMRLRMTRPAHVTPIHLPD